MIDVEFDYKGEKEILNFGLNEKIIEACKFFLTEKNTDLESKIITFNGKENISLNSDKTFSQQIKEMNINDDKCEINIIEDSNKKEGINVVLNIEGEKKVIKAKKGESIMSVFNRLKINLEKMFFLRDGEEFHYFDRSASLIANNNEKENQAIQILGYNKEEDNNENNEQNENNESSEQIDNNMTERNNEIRRMFINNNDNFDERKNKRKYIMKTFSILLIQLSLIILFFWLGCIYNINDKFNESFGAKFATFFIATMFLSMISLFIFLNEDNECKGMLYLYFLFYVSFINFYCFLLTNFTNFKFILFVLFIFLFNYLIIIIYFAFKGSFNIYFIMLPLLLINTIIAILSYYLWKELSIRIIINISIILLVFIIYNAVSIKFSEYNDESTSYPMGRAFIISYAIFIPSGVILVLIMYLLGFIEMFFKAICKCLCCNGCECCHFCDCCDFYDYYDLYCCCDCCDC